MALRLDKKIVIVTGAARGIGEAHAELFSAEGASVVVSDVLVEQGEAVADRLRKKGRHAVFHRLDVSSRADWEEAVSTAVREFGGLTTLVNNAAVFAGTGLQDTSQDDWERVLRVNLTGTFLGMQVAMPSLLQSKNGSIVNISSLYGMIATPGYTAYHASKGGVRMLSRGAALEYARKGVRINSVYPGDTATPAQDNLTAADRAKILGNVPMGWEADPIDIAYGSLYLASDEARYLTGAELVIDGGWSLP